uniref:ShKT domain-containing protein n=1 Tax=Pseudo-nitzschia arenysensis TaxID=697910 RepID=A0A7R9ZUD1_9STRA|mmetsp:Transcript_565/g.1332  ORF Transcript_565/g.1332 Transcript_565/m.1332 type:complete len:994 (+) Transcript_565:271-3252(+)
MNPLSRSKSGSSRRGRSREPRDSYDDDDNSFESYESASSESSYETDSNRHLAYKESTEYESDHGSFSSDSEPPTPSHTEDYSDDDSMDADEKLTMDSEVDSGISTSADEFANEDRSRYDDDDDSENDEDSFGEFNAEDSRFGRNNGVLDEDNSQSDLSDSDSDRSESESEEEEERVKLGEQDDDLFWKRYGYSQQVGKFGDNESKEEHTNPFGQHDLDEEDGESSNGRSNSRTRSGSEFDDGDTFKDELYSQAFPSIARMRTEDSREEIDDPEKSFRKDGNILGKAKDWFQSMLPSKSDNNNSNNNNNNNTRSGAPSKFKSWFDVSDVLEGNFKWYILGAIVLIILVAILGGTLGKKGDKGKTKNIIVADTQPTQQTIELFPTAAPTTFAPTLPPGQLLESITFYVMIPNGKEDGMTEEDLETELLTALDVLAPQVLLNTTNESEANETVGLRGRMRQRKLEALSVNSTTLIDTVIIDCPELPSIDASDLCAKATVEIIIVTDDGTIGFDYSTAMEDAIQGGELQTLSTEFGTNTTIVTLDVDDIVTPAPTMTFSPTTSPAPTVSAAPTSSCYDRDANCEAWANQDPSECVVNPEYMTSNCAKACGMCVTDSPTLTPPTDSPSGAPTMAPTAPSTSNSTIALSTNSTTLGNSTLAPTEFNSTLEPTSDAPSFVPITSNTTQSPTMAPQSCVDKNEACAENVDGIGCLVTKCVLWAGEGECENNPTYMAANCAKSCDQCDISPPTESPTPAVNVPSDPNAPAPTVAPAACTDSNSECSSWASNGQCSKNPGWMLANCALSCNVCESNPTAPTCVDSDNRCVEWAASDECLKNPVWMSNNCKLSCGICQNDDDANEDDASDNGDETGEDNETESDSLIETPPPLCRDNNDRCGEWAGTGECSSNPSWMLENCKLSCNVCTATTERSIQPTSSTETSEMREECVDLREGCHQSATSGDCFVTKCEFWAQEGECEANPSFMIVNCAKSCGKCEELLV